MQAEKEFGLVDRAFPAASVGCWPESEILKSSDFDHFVFISGSERLFSLAILCKHTLQVGLFTWPDGGPSVNM